MAKRKDNVARVKNGIVSAVILLVAGLVAYGLYHAIGFTSDEPYIALDKPDRPGEVEVVVYFSYECPHCRSLENLTRSWERGLPDGVGFRRSHVAYSESNRMFAKAFHALARHGVLEQNHDRLLRAIHDRNRQFNTPASLADFVQGVDRDTFLSSMSSPRVAREVQAAERRFIALGLTTVPAIVVNDKYIVNMGVGRKQALDATGDLVQELLEESADG